MSKFKLLAIRPTDNCNVEFLKNLQKDIFYKFYNDFNFYTDENDNDVVQINHISKVPASLYGTNISVSAVVGRNGSGKSTIVELFNLFVFCLSEHLDLINIDKFKESHELSTKNQNRLDSELANFKSFNCEIYYLVDDKVYGVIKENKSFFSVSFKKTPTPNPNENLFIIEDKSEILNSEAERNNFLSNSFFYSIVANYSLYGLNTNESGIWLKSIFHKNDGYQTPIVLNPMRTEGNIDMNRLTYLSKARLLNNVFKELEEKQSEEESLRSLVNNKVVSEIILKLDFEKFTIVDEDNLKPDQTALDILYIDEKSVFLEFSKKKKNKHDYFRLLVKAFFPDINLSDISFSNSKIKKICKEYILKKVEEVLKKYPQFINYRNRVFRINAKEETVISYFKSLANDFTHSTFKIRQALNFIVYDLYNLKDQNSITYQLATSSKTGIADKVNQKRKALLNAELSRNKQWYLDNPSDSDFERNNKDSYKRHNLINYLPPSFFEIDFNFKKEGFFKDLSSGEKQMIYSINSIIYHLINLDSIYDMEVEDGISYKNFNIVLDEIELYFHPEFQRIFLNELIKSLNYLQGNNYNYNIIFLTHSPFILSDIPAANILKLDKGEIKNNNVDEETYAANVHDLLANDFFLENGFMGEYAKEKIKDLLKYLTYDKKKKSDDDNQKPELEWSDILADEFIQIIGEPLLKYDLRELYLSKFYNEKKIDDEIERLQELKKRKSFDNN